MPGVGEIDGVPPGPAYNRDESGTSFAAPKVARIAAALNRILPDQSALLYRALIVQAARWPIGRRPRLGKSHNWRTARTTPSRIP